MNLLSSFLFFMISESYLLADEPNGVTESGLPLFILVVLIVACLILIFMLIQTRTKVKEIDLRNLLLTEELEEHGEISIALVEMQEKMKVFYEQSIFGLIIIKDDLLHFSNKIALDIFEYSEADVEDWTSDNVLNLVYEDDREEIEHYLKASGPGHQGVTSNYSYRLVSKNKTLKWVEQCSRVINYQGGEAVLVVCIDMTELKQVEEQVSIFKRFAESAGQGLVNMDPMGNPIFVNHFFCSTILAASPQDILVKNITDFYPPKLKDKLLTQIIPAALRDGQWMGELPLLTTTGKMVLTMQTFFKISDAYGKPQHVAVVISDISDRKLVEEELMFTKNYIKNVFHSLESMLISVNSDLTITQWNDAAVSFCGVKAEDAISVNVFEKVPFLKKYKQELEHVIRTRDKLELFKQRLVLGGHEFAYLNISCYPLADDYMDGIVIRVDDVTEMEKNDDQLRQIQKMETVNQLAGGMAHDFNNALCGVKSSISLIELLIQQDDVDLGKVTESLHFADAAANQAFDMMGEVLDVSQKSTLTLHPVDLNSAIKHVGIICKKTFDPSIKFKMCSYDDAAMVDADPAKLENAILNVCRNAQNAMVGMREKGEQIGGELVISIEILLADKHFCSVHPEANEGYYWILRITDTGVGLDNKILSKIFDPFFSTNKSGKGAGLGLSMVYNIIQQHKGFIDIYSEVGVGSTFNIFLPELTGGSSFDILDEEKEEEELHGAGSILVVDDEPIIRLTAKSILEECGYDVLLAESGPAALEILNEENATVDLVLLDMAMPVMSGKGTFAEILKLKSKPKVLMASGFKQDERLNEVFDLGANGFIQKPYSLADLAKKVKAILNESSEENLIV